MVHQHKILILSGSLGDGHMQAAKAIVEAAGLYKPGADVKVVDFMEWIHPRMHIVERYCFKQWVKHLPSLYGYLFRKTREDNKMSQWLKQFRISSLLRLQQLLEEEMPSVIVSTFPSAAAAVSLMKRKGLTRLPSVTIITDHTDHSLWLHPATDLYLVGSERVRQAMLAKGVPSGSIAVTGIPVRPVFNQERDKAALREKYGIDNNAFVALIMGGGWGMIDPSVAEMLQSQRLTSNVQFVIMCGRNDKLRSGLQEEFHGRGDVLVKGYTDAMHEWMALSDVLLTKPGGLTTSEALASGLPMLLFEPRLGQERDNADYLTGIGAALECSADELSDELFALAHNRRRLLDMSERAVLSGHPDSAYAAIGRIVRARPAVSGMWSSTELLETAVGAG